MTAITALCGKRCDGTCPTCRDRSTDPRYAKVRAWMGLQTASVVAGAAECVSLGKHVPPPEGKNPNKEYHVCEAGYGTGGVVCKCDCGPKCPGYDTGDLVPLTVVKPSAKPRRTVVPYRPDVPFVRRIDGSKLVPGPADARFNSSIIRYAGKLLLAYRTGWAGAKIHVAELSEDFTPGRSATLAPLNHPSAEHGQEDPRLFVYRGRLHVSYTGVTVASGQTITNVLYARLSDRYEVEEVFAPHYSGRRVWEKNWACFDWQGMLLAVYSISPHVILHIQGNQAYPFAETANPFPWSGGELRGGAPPVLIRDQWYCFFHGREGGYAHGRYNVGCLTFENRPPFRVTALSPEPILKADPATKPADQSWEPAVVFPAGAILERGQWLVSMGVHDRFTDVATFDADEIERVLGNLDPLPVPTFTGDVVLTSVLVQGDSPHGVYPGGGKSRKPLRDMDDDELVGWLAPTAWNATKWGCQIVVLHDGLRKTVRDRLPVLTFVRVNPGDAYGPYERRWFAARGFLDSQSAIDRVWCIDAGDVVFTADPFGWLTDGIAVAEEEDAYGGNTWVDSQVSRLPAGVKEFLTTRHADRLPLSCGSWGGIREDVAEILWTVCGEIDRYTKYCPDRSVVKDMAAFGSVLLKDYPNRLRTFPRFGGESSPLVHGRDLCDKLLAVGS